MAEGSDLWPALDWKSSQATIQTLHLWCQIVGKYRLSLTPWQNHSWHATLYVTPTGLSTGPVPDVQGPVTVAFDFVDQTVTCVNHRGDGAGFDLEAMSVADFHDKVAGAIRAIGGTFNIHGTPNEIPDAIPFRKDTGARSYDPASAAAFHGALVSVDRVFNHFKTGYLGKVSPSHLFWGSFDLAVTRFSGRSAPLHPGGIPGLPDDVAQEAYSHEVASSGFWAGGGGVEEAMFYAYAYPTPDAYKGQPVLPAQAYWDTTLSEFLLPYEAVRSADDPEAALMAFLMSTYEAAATTGDWDREALECALGQPGKPRAL